MAQQKQSGRQISDAAAAALFAPKVASLVGAPVSTTKSKHTKPDSFVGDRPGYFRGARVRR